MDIGRDGIVDERRFGVTNMGNENPVTARDYLAYPRMEAMVEMIEKAEAKGAVWSCPRRTSTSGTSRRCLRRCLPAFRGRPASTS